MGAAWNLPAWMEDTDLTIHSKPAFLLWLLYRGVGCNVTPVAKRIVYFKERPPPLGQSASAPHSQHREALPHRKLLEISGVHAPVYKFHSVAISDGSEHGLNDWPLNREVAVNYARPVTSQPPSQYSGELCYTHVVPRATPAHTVSLTTQDMARGCPGIEAPYETIVPSRTVSVQTADGSHRPMLETQIYSVYPMSVASPFNHEPMLEVRSAGTQTTEQQLVSTEESLPLIDDGSTVQDCASHYWNASYPELPSVRDFPVSTQRYVYNQATPGGANAFREAALRADTPPNPPATRSTFFQMPMIYFYHY